MVDEDKKMAEERLIHHAEVREVGVWMAYVHVESC